MAGYLDLTVSVPGLSSSPSMPSSEGGLRDLDINQVPSGGEEDMEVDEEESNGGTTRKSFIPGDTFKSLAGLVTPSRRGPPRKKLRLSKEQSRLLEDSFRHHHTLNPKQKEALAEELKLRPRQVEVWFQNRRARSKLKQTEMECEYLKRWFGSLTEQNRRLQREVEELRAMKVGPHSHDPASPASTLTMCPRCERVTTNNVVNVNSPASNNIQTSAACT